MDLSNKTLAELRALAKEQGIRGVTSLRKPELVKRLEGELSGAVSGETPAAEEKGTAVIAQQAAEEKTAGAGQTTGEEETAGGQLAQEERPVERRQVADARRGAQERMTPARGEERQMPMSRQERGQNQNRRMPAQRPRYNTKTTEYGDNTRPVYENNRQRQDNGRGYQDNTRNYMDNSRQQHFEQGREQKRWPRRNVRGNEGYDTSYRNHMDSSQMKNTQGRGDSGMPERENNTFSHQTPSYQQSHNGFQGDTQHGQTGQVQQNISYTYNAQQKVLYHDGSDGLISIIKDRQVTEIRPVELKEFDSGITRKGVLEVMPEGYGFLRCDNFLPGESDVYVAPQFIRRFGVRTGDIIEGNLRIKTANEKFSALLYMKKVNDQSPSYLYEREKFENLTPVFPDERIHLETPGAGISMRMLDLISPIGKGQRGMIVSQPKTGKTTLLKQVAKAVTRNYPKMQLMILLIDERPEEVTDIRESIEGDNVSVIYSTFDELPENHKRVSEMTIERAKRMVEDGKDVMILLDSITRLARAYNLTVTPSGRTLSGGLDPAALHMPKRFFGAARNMREGGSLTILATALVDTGSRMDDVVFEEFKGTGNMELVLDRSLSEKRIFPAIDIQKSSTRREDLLLSASEQEVVTKIRKALSGMKSDHALEQILDLFRRTKDNNEFVETVKKMHL